MAARLSEWGVPNVMLCGTTGESVSLSKEERYEVVAAWMPHAKKYNLNVYVHVGMNSEYEARDLARSISLIDGVKGFLAMGPTYFKPSTAEALVNSMSVIASGAPHLPFWYYHFPDMTNIPVNMYDFIREADKTEKIPNLMGIKFTNELLMDFNQIGNFKNKKYNMLMGRDEIFTSALTTGVADGGVGSTLNFMSFNIPMRELYMSGDQDKKD